DEVGLIANDAYGDAGRQRLLNIGQFFLDGADDLDRVGARLAAHVEGDALFTVDHIPGRRLGEAVFDAAHIIDAYGRAVDVGDDDVAELRDCVNASERAHAHFGFA